VSWLTSDEARPLLEHNPFIHHLETKLENLKGQFDLVINLERTEVKKTVNGKVFLGYIDQQILFSPMGTYDFSTWMRSDEIKNLNWSQKLFLIVGKIWNGENYILIPREKIPVVFDLGLNWKVGPKWPSKSWPLHNWEQIYKRISKNYSVSFQEGFDSIPAYINWIQSCHSLLTHDSLGLHIGLALKKPMTALFGPTSSREISLEKTRILSLAEEPSFSCPPCHQEQCHSNIHCVGAITLDAVETEVRDNLKDRDGSITIRRKQAITSS
jgi:heptosyltransferase-2